MSIRDPIDICGTLNKYYIDKKSNDDTEEVLVKVVWVVAYTKSFFIVVVVKNLCFLRPDCPTVKMRDLRVNKISSKFQAKR